MERNCRYVPLDAQPLILALAQVRFSRLRQLHEFIPEIQESFRRDGFPIERYGQLQQVIIAPGGGQPRVIEENRWEYRVKDETRSITLTEDSFILQAGSYTRFEEFAKTMESALATVFRLSEHEKFGVVERVGLRYIDLIQPGEGESHRDYLQPGFHGASDSVFEKHTHRVFVESVGRTKLHVGSGTMILRVAQDNSGTSLPPDLLIAAPVHSAQAKRGELVTFVDMDHFFEAKVDASAEWATRVAFELHDHIIETFHEHVASEHAMKVWK